MKTDLLQFFSAFTIALIILLALKSSDQKIEDRTDAIRADIAALSLKLGIPDPITENEDRSPKTLPVLSLQD